MTGVTGCAVPQTATGDDAAAHPGRSDHPQQTMRALACPKEGFT
jgi:hypothetical protein